MPSRRKLRSETINVFHIDEYNRVLAFHRWVRGLGRDVVVAVSLREQSFENGSYNLGFPLPGRWYKVFNSDVYDFFPNSRRRGMEAKSRRTGRCCKDCRTRPESLFLPTVCSFLARDTGD